MAKELAVAAKNRGNAAFGKGDFKVAVDEFTEAIKHDPTDHVFYSNRSGAYASLNQFEEALNDANQCIEINQAFGKGYSRKGLALLKMNKLKDAKAAYEEGLKIDPANQAAKDGLKDVEKAMSGGGPGGGLGALFGEQMWTRLATDPVTRDMLKDQNFRTKMQMLQKNPNMMSSMMGDPQMSAALGVILGLGSSGFQTASPGMGDEDAFDKPMAEPKAKPAEKPAEKPAAKEDEKGDGDDMEDEDVEEIVAESGESEEEKQRKANQKLAEKEKELGNAAYKKKEFDTALTHYNKAAELDPVASVFHNNMAAVYFEIKDYEKCVEKCKKAIELEKAKKSGFDYVVVGKAWVRIGNAYEKAGKLAESEEAFQSSLLEDFSEVAKKSLKRVKERRKKEAEESYINPELSEAAKERGNKHFADGKWQEAIEEYSEALKRNPKNYKVYSNRAACYTKLMAWNQGLEDCEKCLSFDPNFVKAYIRKGKIEHFLKKYHIALQTYETALKLDPKCTDLLEAQRLTMQKINEENQSGVDPQRAQEAMKDPEIQSIMRDPMVQSVLQSMQENPAAASSAFNDPHMRSKLEKLIAAGIVRMG